MNAFLPADILIPLVEDMEKWAVIACDQFTSDPAYWARVDKTVGEAPSALRLILPEAELGSPQAAQRIGEIHRPMDSYLVKGLFKTSAGAFVYVERTMNNGSVRKGLVGMADPECSEYCPDAPLPSLATEHPVTERPTPAERLTGEAS